MGLGGCQTAWIMLHEVRTALDTSTNSQLSGDVEVDWHFIGGSGHFLIFGPVGSSVPTVRARAVWDLRIGSKS